MTIPLRHFVVGLGFLLAGALAGVAATLGVGPGYASLAHVHLLLAGWVCVTIMGAMTQFVPVWSGVRLHSQRLASVQLWLVAAGLTGFAACLLTRTLTLLPVFGAAMLAGFWTFAYNVGRTLRQVDSYDVTERHFGFALGFFVLVTSLGFLLAVDLVTPVFAPLSLLRVDVVQAHATLAVFGAVLTTVVGALYQLATMFTQTDLRGVDVWIRRVEEVGYPAGVLALAAGRLVDSAALARVGGVLVVASMVGVSVILARRLYETRVERSPMLSRYAVVAVATALWALLALPAWLSNPLAADVVFGAPRTMSLLFFGVVGFVVFGTLYHVVPFIVWVHRYSDLVGYEKVPMVDELYDDSIAAADFACLLAGTSLLVAGDVLSLPAPSRAVGGAFVLAGAALFAGNVLRVVREHSPHSLTGVVAGSGEADSDAPVEPSGPPDGR